jgi:glucose/arabinose dehydrogenase
MLNAALALPTFLARGLRHKAKRGGTYTLLTLTAALSLTACGDLARLQVADGSGLTPTLPEPRSRLIPTVNIAPAVGWPDGVQPSSAAGTQVNAFARGLDHPRWLLTLPNGDVLVAETNAPAKPDNAGGIRGMVMGMVMKRAGAATPSANRITLLRDSQGNGTADQRFVLLEGLNSPFGMAWVDGMLYVANTDAVVRFPYPLGDTRISTVGEKMADLPAGNINHHWTKSLIASPDGQSLYVTVGSNSNVGERGMDVEEGRAAVWKLDIKSGNMKLFAGGLRNPNGMAWEPVTGVLWTVVNERDELGSDLVPDYLTSVVKDGFYGWPYSWYGDHVDVRVKPPRPDLVASAIVPDYALGPHTASLGLAWADGTTLPTAYSQGMFIGQHGSWNRRPHSGYKVVYVPFAQGKPSGLPVDVMAGFLSPEGNAYGRPVGVVMDKGGALLVADDVGNVIWRLSAVR